MPNDDHPPYYEFTGPQRLDTAVATLHGILSGVSADGVVNQQEVALIDQWIRDNADIEGRHPFNEFMPLLRGMVANDDFDPETVRDVQWLCERIHENEGFYGLATCKIQELQGILAGIVADRTINEAEVALLATWLSEHESLTSIWPYDEIASLLHAVLEDGVIDEAEQELLLRFFAEFSRTDTHRAVSPRNVDLLAPTVGVCAAHPDISFRGRSFCFTGASKRASRILFIEVVKSLGGNFVSHVSARLDYLIIGGSGNPCWAYACYGRKVEEAMRLRKCGSRIMVVHENDFWDAAEKAGYIEGVVRESPKEVKLQGPAELMNLLEPHLSELQALGWHIIVDPSGCYLHLLFKNGMPRKTPMVSVFRFCTAHSCTEGPYSVMSPDLICSRPFKDINEAVGFFLSAARATPTAR